MYLMCGPLRPKTIGDVISKQSLIEKNHNKIESFKETHRKQCNFFSQQTLHLTTNAHLLGECAHSEGM
jgi:hypothetical protein